MGLSDLVIQRIRKDWSVLERAKTSLGIVVIVALAVGGWAGFSVANYVLRERMETLQERAKTATKPAPVIEAKQVLMGYGRKGGMGCSAVVDFRPVLDFQNTHDLFILCGLVDERVDRETDTRTSLSPPLSIRPEAQASAWDLSSEMAAAQDALGKPARDAVLKDLESKKLAENLGIVVVTNKWYEVVLIPKTSRKAEIHSLQDVKALGGKILSREGYFASGISAQ